ncbi:hypothetical protein TWF225_011514 [Orbilia oligospora]|nr:hypothetical protein TWF225_011514 [Orbilia oligospora]KAF3243777.1 hypothetical protein TWF128_009971 [Orbilia oligospora]KAF3243778.1 hypothetical protein TWF128_009971 [Orbilia oligospora]KAF3294914.1 hypothetical protein TWF132_012093 [Orbilia oligospora]
MTTLAVQNRDTVRQPAPVPVHGMPPANAQALIRSNQPRSDRLGRSKRKFKVCGDSAQKQNYNCDKILKLAPVELDSIPRTKFFRNLCNCSLWERGGPST